MPTPTLFEIRVNNIRTGLTPALALLNELSDAFGPPFLQPISKTVVSLMTTVQVRIASEGAHPMANQVWIFKNVKRNKNECAQPMENLHKILYAIVNLHIKSGIAGGLPPSMLDHIGKFME